MVRMNRTLHGVFLLISITGVVIVLWSTSTFGLGVDSDSVDYFSAAANLSKGVGLIGPDGMKYTAWPPLFPTILSIFVSQPIPLDRSFAPVQAIVFGLIIFSSGLLMWQCTQSDYMSIVLATMALFSPPLIYVCTQALSEPIFILLCNLFFLATVAYIKKPSTAKLLVLASIASLACLQRYIGVALLIAGIIVFILFLPKPPKMQRTTLVTNLVFFTFVSGFPILIWTSSLFFSQKSIVFRRAADPVMLLSGVQYALHTLTGWFVSLLALPVFKAISIWLIFSLLVIAVRGIIFSLTTETKQRLFITGIIPLVLVGMFTILLLGIMIYEQGSIEPIDDRLLSPIYVPVMIFVLVGLNKMLKQFKFMTYPIGKLTHMRLRLTFITVCTIWLLSYPIDKAIAYTQQIHAEGSGQYNTTAWKSSEIVKWLHNNPLKGIILSNDSRGITYATGQQAVSIETTDLASIKDYLKSPNSHVYVVNWENRGVSATAQAGAKDIIFSLLAKFPDSEIYTLLLSF